MVLKNSNLYKDDLNRAVNAIDLSSLDGKVVFITGGLGLIGSAIVDVLQTYGKVKKIYIGARNYEQYSERFGEDAKVSFVQYDALDKLELNIIPDYIIYGAGLASPELYVEKPVETILSNTNGLQELLDFAKDNQIKRLIYISSSEVYGNVMSAKPYDEKQYGIIDIDNVRSSYAVAKRVSEMLCRAYCTEYGVDTCIVRPGHIYGPSAKRADRRVSSAFAFSAAEGNKIELKSTGEQRRSYCYTVDCAAQILYVLLKGEKGQAYNIGHNEIISIREMAELFAKIGNVELVTSSPCISDINKFNPMNNSALNNEKVKALGYKDIFSIQEGIEHTVRILRGE